MQDIQSRPVPISAPPRRMPWYFIGILLFLIGPAIYILQFRMRQLVVPWYAPVLASIGVLCLIASVMRRRGILRVVGLVLLTVVCGLEWFFLLVVAKSPAYEGPAQVGAPCRRLLPRLPTASRSRPRNWKTVVLLLSCFSAAGGD